MAKKNKKGRKKRGLFEKEDFVEGNRQKWLVVFLLCMFVVMGLDAAGKIHDVNAYLTFLSFTAGAFILGYSGSETMKLFKSDSMQQDVDETQNENFKGNTPQALSQEFVERTPRPRDLDDGSID